MDYLSPQWIDAMAAAVGADATLAEAAGDLRTVIVVSVDEVSYHLLADHGRVELKPGPAADADLVLRQSRATAVAVATGALNPGRAFLDGRIQLEGSAETLVRTRPLLEALERATAGVRQDTLHA